MIKKNNVSHGLETQRREASLKMGRGGGWQAGVASRTRTQSEHTGHGDSDFQGGKLASSHRVWRPA